MIRYRHAVALAKCLLVIGLVDAVVMFSLGVPVYFAVKHLRRVRVERRSPRLLDPR